MIELDLSRPWDADDPLGFGERPPAHGWRNPPRWLVPTLLAVVVAAVLGGAAAPQRHDPVLALRIPSADLIFGRDDTAFLFQQRSRSGRLQAYRPERPGPLWTVDYPNGNPVPVVTTDPGLVLVSVYDANPGQGSETLTEARDSRTGRKLWQRTGMGIIGQSSGILFVTDYFGWDGADVDPARPGKVEAVDVRTGTALWSHAVGNRTLFAPVPVRPSGPPFDARADADGLAELDQDGMLRVLDPASGEVRHTIRLPLSGPALNLTVQDGMAVVGESRPAQDPSGPDRGIESIVAYDLETGEERWRAEAPDYAMPCGERYICGYGPQRLTVADPETGDVRYEGQAERTSFRGNLLVVSRPVGVSGGVMTGSEVWDLTTGRKLRSLGAWYMVTEDPRASDLAAQNGVGGVLMIAKLDLRTGTARVIGRARDWLGDASCTFGRRYLGCTGPGGVRVWRLPTT